MAKAIGIGIDLGTTNSVAAHPDNQRILLNRDGSKLTPSVVSKKDSEILVGRKALNRIISFPEDTITSIKRIMGRAYNDPNVQKAKELLHYKIVPPSEGTEDSLGVIMGEKEYSPVEISSMILKKIKEDTEHFLNEEVDRAVITVPAYFTDKQRDATREAGWKAGFRVQTILSEPSAAAIAYGIENLSEEEQRYILVFDLGGGTLDITTLVYSGGIFQELDCSGNMWLGGDDFTQKIMDEVLNRISTKYEVDIYKMPKGKRIRFLGELRNEAQRAKERLSEEDEAEIILTGTLEDEERNLIDVCEEITREQFEKMILPEVDKSMDLVHQSLENCHLTPEDIHNVLLVGGSTLIPLIQRKIIDIFGKDKVLIRNPMTAVAKGASIVSKKCENIQCPNCKAENPLEAQKCFNCGENLERVEPVIVYGTVTPVHYGIQTIGDRFEPIIEKGTPYPLDSEPEEFFTAHDNARRLKVVVYAGMNEVASKNEKQQTIWMQLPPNVAKGTSVYVSLSLNRDGVLEWTKLRLVMEDGSSKEVTAYAGRGGKWRDKAEDTLERLQKKYEEKGIVETDRFEKLYNEAIDALNTNDKQRAENNIQQIEEIIRPPDYKKIAENLIAYTENALKLYGKLVEQEQKDKIQGLIQELKQAVRNQNQEIAEKKIKELNSELDSLYVVNYIMSLQIGLNEAGRKGMSAERQIISENLTKIHRAIANDDHDAFVKALDDPEAREALEKVFGQSVSIQGETGLIKEKIGKDISMYGK